MDKYHASIIDTDLYKLSMGNVVTKLYPRAVVRYEFFNRDNREFPDGFDRRFREIVDSFRGIRLKKDERDFLGKTCYYLDPAYLDFLNGYTYDPSEVTIWQEGPQLTVSITGLWFRTIYWEVPLMATISELFFEMTGQRDIPDSADESDKTKFRAISELGIPTSDFGARRRHSYKNHARMLRKMVRHCNVLTGTSNVHLAMENGLIPIGTMAHEFLSYHAARYGFKMATSMALEAWCNIYQGELGLALPDTFTTDVFLRSFGTKYSKLFDGVRHDSGNPLEFTTKIIKHYRNLKINPMHKVIVFSDGINSINTISEIKTACEGQIQPRLGIGTWLTADFPNIKPLNIVIKMTGAYIDGGWSPVIKLSDNLSKHTGDINMIRICKETLNIG